MKDKKGFEYSIITVVVYIFSKTILNVIGVNNIPYQIMIALILGALMIFIMGVIRSKAVGLLKVYYIIFTVLLLSVCAIVILGMVMKNYYPQMFILHEEILKIVSVTLFVLLGVFVVATRNINKKPNK